MEQLAYMDFDRHTKQIVFIGEDGGKVWSPMTSEKKFKKILDLITEEADDSGKKTK